MEIRRFVPKRTDDLKKAAVPYIGKLVSVRSWHSNMAMRDNYPNDERVGYIEDFGLDIPESELLYPHEAVKEKGE
jgi:hypothetical protein